MILNLKSIRAFCKILCVLKDYLFNAEAQRRREEYFLLFFSVSLRLCVEPYLYQAMSSQSKKRLIPDF